jgi:hypothetical protein
MIIASPIRPHTKQNPPKRVLFFEASETRESFALGNGFSSSKIIRLCRGF